MKWKKKGYLTVEASFVITLSILMTGFVISLCFHVYQRCWYTQAACETVLTGSGKGNLKGRSAQEKANEKWNVLKNECYLQPHNLKVQHFGGEDQVSCDIIGETSVWGGKSLGFHAQVSQKIIRPVIFIRRTEALLDGKK